ncbi:MAG: extracellular solute-binding protein [Ruminococcaceae bacterium]|nr:extracellular solute-binding protein [Oscillospiraceae bacterium]
MKKILLSVLLLVAMIVNVFAMVGCKPKNDDDNSGNGGLDTTPPPAVDVVAYDGSAVEITFYHTMGQALTNVLASSLADFNAMYPNIKVVHQSLGNYDGLRNQINTELGGGKQPNIAYCYPDHVAIYKDLKGVLPLDAFINSTLKVNGTDEIMGLTAEQQADFVKAYWDEGKVFDAAGTMYTLPMAKSTEALFYNKTFFDEFDDGQGPLEVPTTWEEMETVCRRIKAKYPNSIPLGYDSESNWFITRLAQAGADYTSIDPKNHYTFNNLTAVDILTEANEWYQDGLVKTQKTNDDSYTSNLFTIASNDAKDKAFMVIGSTGGASYQTPPKADDKALFEVGITGIPQQNAAAPKTISQGPSLCLFKDSNPQEVAASWLLIKFLTTNVKFQSKFSIQSGYAPVIGAAKEDPIYKDWLDAANGSDNLQALCVKTTVSQEHAYFTSPAFNGSSKARTEAENMMYNIMTYNGTKVREQAGTELATGVANCKKTGK